MAGYRRRTWKTKNGKVNESWEYSFYTDEGEQKKKGGFATKKAAEEHFLKYHNANVKVEARKLTFYDAAKAYMDSHASIHCKVSTVETYRSFLNAHLIPYFGDKKVIELTPMMFNNFIKTKLDSGLAKKSVNHMLTLCHSIFQYYIDIEVITSSPMKRVKKLKIDFREMNFLSTEEIKIALDKCQVKYPDFYPLLATAIFTGARRGEILALNWTDINFVKKQIYFNKTFSRGKVGTPKTETSRRRVSIPDFLVEILKNHRKNNFNSIVFCNQTGAYLDADNLVKRRFTPLMKAIGCPEMRFHDLRHTYAAMMIEKNVQIKYIQRNLGHSSIQVTIDNYGHLMPEIATEAMQKLDDAFGSTEKKDTQVG